MFCLSLTVEMRLEEAEGVQGHDQLLVELDLVDDLLVLVDLGRVLQQILLLVQQQKANETN